MALLVGEAFVDGMCNLEAAQKADIVALTVPYAAHRTTLESVKEALKGKILIDVTVPLVPPKVATVQMPPLAPPHRKQERSLAMRCRFAPHFKISHSKT